MGDRLRGLIDVGAIILVNLLGFAFIYGRLTQRLADHISLVSRWQKEIADWRREHDQEARERSELVTRIEKLQERQQVIAEYMEKNLERINTHLWS